MTLIFYDTMYVDKAIEIGKTGIPIKFIRDGTRSEKDIDVIMRFKNNGFIYDIKKFKGKYEENAVCVDFYFASQENGYIQKGNNMKKLFKQIVDWFLFIMTGKGKLADEMIELDLISYEGQGRDKNGR